MLHPSVTQEVTHTKHTKTNISLEQSLIHNSQYRYKIHLKCKYTGANKIINETTGERNNQSREQTGTH